MSPLVDFQHKKKRSRIRWVPGIVAVGALACAPAGATGSSPWASQVVSFDAGAGGIPGYTDPQSTLGAPERFTGETIFPSAVTIFNPAYGPDELYSFGEGGHLTVEFELPITDDPSHLFGVDLIVFGNGGFEDVDLPYGQCGDPAFNFGVDPMRVLVSANGQDFIPLGEFTEGQFPAQGWLDVPPYTDVPGNLPTDFRRPVDPSLALSDFDGLTYAQALALYDGSGGGTPIDISTSGLSEVRYVRIESFAPGVSVEIEAFAVVPEPSGLMLFALTVLLDSAFRRMG
ncbi:MAG: hypothetical protein HRF50_02205 [Phycisphaerae bacterium]|jgi:hypothetical protein